MEIQIWQHNYRSLKCDEFLRLKRVYCQIILVYLQLRPLSCRSQNALFLADSTSTEYRYSLSDCHIMSKLILKYFSLLTVIYHYSIVCSFSNAHPICKQTILLSIREMYMNFMHNSQVKIDSKKFSSTRHIILTHFYVSLYKRCLDNVHQNCIANFA